MICTCFYVIHCEILTLEKSQYNFTCKKTSHREAQYQKMLIFFYGWSFIKIFFRIHLNGFLLFELVFTFKDSCQAKVIHV